MLAAPAHVLGRELISLSQLGKYPALNNLEKQTSVPKVYAVIGAATLYFFFIVFNLGGQLLTNFAGFVLPGYYSLAALFSTSKTDDTQWLTVSVSAIQTVAQSEGSYNTNFLLVLGGLCLLHVS